MKVKKVHVNIHKIPTSQLRSLSSFCTRNPTNVNNNNYEWPKALNLALKANNGNPGRKIPVFFCYSYFIVYVTLYFI